MQSLYINKIVTWEDSLTVPHKDFKLLSHDQENEKMKAYIHKETCIHAGIIHNRQKTERAQMCIN